VTRDAHAASHNDPEPEPPEEKIRLCANSTRDCKFYYAKVNIGLIVEFRIWNRCVTPRAVLLGAGKDE
jgi:hypothetical protein